MNESFTYIDLFAGIGGLRIPFDDLPLTGICVFTSEKDASARATYLSNFASIDPTWHITNTDITEYYDTSLHPEKFNEIPNHDLLLAGFPCQPFSMAGKRVGDDDERALFHTIFETTKAKRPRILLLENVRGLKSIDGGRTFLEIQKSIKSLGYTVPEPKVLNARDFGLPQNRNRLFIVAIREDIPDAENYEFPAPTHDRSVLRVGEILDKNADNSLIISDRLWDGHRRRKEQNQAAGKGFGFQMFNGDSPYTATISARYYKDGSEILIENLGGNPRLLSVNEARKLQGFPETFKTNSSKKEAYRQFGNAVPVSVVRAIAQSLLSYLV
jgi:DNA (cytosine-5)-methyltransferase 1